MYYHDRNVLPSPASDLTSPRKQQFHQQWTGLLKRTSRTMIRLLEAECQKHVTLLRLELNHILDDLNLHVVLLHLKKSNASFLTLQLNYIMKLNLDNAKNNRLAVGMLLVLLFVHVNLILLTFSIDCILLPTVHIRKSRHPLIIFAITNNPSKIPLTPLPIIFIYT